MIIDVRTVPDGETLEADVCVIGAGAAGISIALRLGSAGTSVCLLEAGGFEYDDESQALYQGTVRGREYFDLEITRLRYFGGTTNHWTGHCRLLDSIDFAPRPYIHPAGWPISYGDVEPYYPAASDLCQVTPYGYSVTDFPDRVPPLVLKPLAEHGAAPRLWRQSPPTMFGVVYRDAIEQSDRIKAYLHANVVGLDVGGPGSPVTAVRVRTFDGQEHTVRARAFVLACGGIENARILLNPTPTRPDGVGNETDQVGRYFSLHPILEAGRVVPSPSGVSLFEGKAGGADGGLFAGIAVSDAIQRGEGLPNHAVHFESAGVLHWFMPPGYKTLKRRLKNPFHDETTLGDDIAVVLAEYEDIAGYIYRRGSDRIRRLWSGDSNAARVYDVVFRMEQVPSPDNRITLGADRDALGMPRPVLTWSFQPDEKPNVRRTLESLARTLGALGAGRMQIADWIANDAAPWPQWVHGDHHHLCSTRMSETPETGVVDRNCRVHTVSNLFVAGSSVYPVGGSANPTLSIVALSLRLADHLEERLRQGFFQAGNLR